MQVPELVAGADRGDQQLLGVPAAGVAAKAGIGYGDAGRYVAVGEAIRPNVADSGEDLPADRPAIAATVDQPIAALLQDLKASGLFKDTLLVWTTEFGRTPFAQGSVGREKGERCPGGRLNGC